jgi:hypothetical protein
LIVIACPIFIKNIKKTNPIPTSWSIPKAVLKTNASISSPKIDSKYEIGETLDTISFLKAVTLKCQDRIFDIPLRIAIDQNSRLEGIYTY